MKLSKTIQPLIDSDIKMLSFSKILSDEDYLDDKKNPLMCFHCDSTKIIKFYKTDIELIDEKYKKQIHEICPNLDDSIVTFWICQDCDEVIAVKLYSQQNIIDKKIYITKYDSFSQVVEFLKQKNYITKEREPITCWHCDSDEIEIIEENDCSCSKCKNCGSILGYNSKNFWRIELD